jgi:hypothetical protein
VTTAFGAAVFLKPAAGSSSGPVFDLAPLLMQEVREGNAPDLADLDPFGTLTNFNGATSLDTSRAAIYWAVDSLPINGKSHPRFSYRWCYSVPERRIRPTRLPWQGIRITLDSQAQPAIWEVLADTVGARLIFVSQSVESAAAAEFGKPLAGRRYAVERAIDDAPNVIVPRVVDDGPAAMGPIVYVSARTRDVSTVICRCMPAQVKRLIATRSFDLVANPDAAAGALVASWPGEGHGEDRLEDWLRLPRGF